MSNKPKEGSGPLKYILSSISFTCFRAFQYIQRLEFISPKRNMMILASNSFGKTGIVDGMEFIMSEDSTVERIGDEVNKVRNKAGPDALRNAFRVNEKCPSSIRVEIEVFDESLITKTSDFWIERTVGAPNKIESNSHIGFLNAIRVSPIIRGEESNSFVTELSPYLRFEKIATWTRRKSLLGIMIQLREAAAKSPTAETAFESGIIAVNTKLANATDHKIIEWNKYAVREFINNELLAQIDPMLKMSNLKHSDPIYLQLKKNFKALRPPSTNTQKNTKQQDKNTLLNVIENIEILLDICNEYNELRMLELDTISNIEKAKNRFKIASRELISEMQHEVNQLHQPMNKYFQLITGNSDKKIFLQIELDEETDEGLIHLTSEFAPGLTDALPSGYFSNAEKHAFVLAFQLAYVKVFNQDAKILILDDLVTSIDAGYRNRIVSLILEEFSDFQIIATTHDDLFFLSMYAGANTDEWTFCRIIRFDPDHGPVFDTFRPTREEMQFMWDHGQSALTLLRQQMEHDFEQLIKDLGIKMRVLRSAMFDSYSLNEKINAVSGYFKEIGLDVPKLEGVQKNTLEYFASTKYVNTGIHNRDKTHSNISNEDEQGLVKQYYRFMDWFSCTKCGNKRFKTVGKKKPAMTCRVCDKNFKFQVTK